VNGDVVTGWNRNWWSLGTLVAEGSCQMHQKPGRQIIFCWLVWLLRACGRDLKVDIVFGAGSEEGKGW
jgi:hypothetical protein